MSFKPLLAATALAVAALASSTAANASGVGAPAHAGPASQSAPTPPSACAKRLRMIEPSGPAGGHYVGTCPPYPRWVPARGPAGGHYDYATNSCMRLFAARGLAGGRLLDTCRHQPRFVSARGPAGGHYAYYPAATSILGSKRSNSTPAQASAARSWGLDWESAAIGAATTLAALAIALATTSAVRRRRIAKPRPLPTH